MTKSLVVLISGEGSNLQAIIDAIQRQELTATITAVISNNCSARGLMRAALAGINSHIVTNHEPELSHELQTKLLELNPDLIVLAGFMRILNKNITDAFPNKIINIHPSLLPKHPGLHTHQRAIDASDQQHGCTVHYVDHTLDGGPIIAQSSLTISATDTEKTLQTRVQQLEHVLYPKVIQQLITRD